jgi:hypothetical protein
MRAVAHELEVKICDQEITLDVLWELFSSGNGAGIVGQAMFRPIMEGLGKV